MPLLAHGGGEHERAVALAGADLEDFRAGGNGPYVLDDVDAVEALGFGDGELLVGVDVEAYEIVEIDVWGHSCG